MKFCCYCKKTGYLIDGYFKLLWKNQIIKDKYHEENYHTIFNCGNI